MPVRAVVFASEQHGRLLRETLARPPTVVMTRHELGGATCLGGAVAFISFDLLPTIDPASVMVPIVAIVDVEPKNALNQTMRVFGDFPWVSHVVAAQLIGSDTGVGHLATLLERLEVGADQRQLGATGRGRKALLTTASRREPRFDRIRGFFEKNGISPRVIHSILDASEELVMNALYDAPLEAGYFERPYERNEDVELPDYLACEISYGIDNDAAFVCLRDPFGSLTRARLMEVLSRCKVEGGAVEIDPSRGGAGLGLWRLFTAASTIAIHVIPGTLTEIFVSFATGASRKGLKPVAIDLFFTRHSPPVDPFAPPDELDLMDNSVTIVQLS